jgi:hypothetical protein
MNQELKGSLAEASAGLIYISETDAEITPFEGGQTGAVTAAELLAQAGHAADAPVEERGFEEIFARLTRVYEGADEAHVATAGRFAALKSVLEQNLRGLKVFKVGKIQLDVYIVGLDAEGNLSGVQTKAVET